MKRQRDHKRMFRAFTVVALLLWSSSAQAQTDPTKEHSEMSLGEDIFQRLSPSVFVIEALDNDGSVVALGSGVAVGPSEVVTNTHVIDPGVRIRIRQRRETWPAEIEHISLHTDLCRLKVDGLSAPPVPLRPSKSLATGELVYAIGSPEGLELSISGGLISAVRELDGEELIQTTAAISHGSSGGGLFDRQGKLVGITTFMFAAGQNLNFSLPIDSVLEPITQHDSELIEKQMNPGRSYDDAVRAFGKEEVDRDIEVVRLSEDVLRKNPGDSHVHAVLGDRILNRDPHRALRELDEAVRLNPSDVEAHEELGIVLDRIGDPYGAAKELREAEQMAPDQVGPHFALKDVLLELDNTQGSLREVRQVARLKRKWMIPFVFVPVAESMAKDGDLTSARAVCDEIRMNNEDSTAEADGHYCLGAELLAERPPRVARAVLEMREAVRLNPESSEYHHALAKTLEMGGNQDQALNEYKLAFDLYPESTEYKADYERALAHAGKHMSPTPSLGDHPN